MVLKRSEHDTSDALAIGLVAATLILEGEM